MENVWIKMWMIRWIVCERRKTTRTKKESNKRGENDE